MQGQRLEKMHTRVSVNNADQEALLWNILDAALHAYVSGTTEEVDLSGGPRYIAPSGATVLPGVGGKHIGMCAATVKQLRLCVHNRIFQL